MNPEFLETVGTELRRMAVNMIEDYARHNGHADLPRGIGWTGSPGSGGRTGDPVRPTGSRDGR